MPGRRFSYLAQQFISHLELGGATVIIGSDMATRPLRCQVTMGNFSATLDIYLWTITTGGKGRGRPNERRIQLTAVQAFRLRPGVRTVVGGWSDEVGVYAFWDVRRHLTFTAGSPSLQTSLTVLEDAYREGMSAQTRHVREGDEIAIALQRDYLLWYLDEWERLYECQGDVDHANRLIVASTEDERLFIDSGEDNLERSRRHKVVSIVHNFREARFRPMVLRAYNYRCCVTGVALRIVDAAHIIPVADPTSTDDVTNGLALSANLHRAYDNGLVGILPGGRVAINERIASRLQDDRLAAGLAEFKATLPRVANFPALREFRPQDEVLKRGLIARGWSDDETTYACA